MHLLSFFSFSRFSLIYVFGLRTRGLIGWAPFSLEYRGGAMHVIDGGDISLHGELWGLLAFLPLRFPPLTSYLGSLFIVIFHYHHSLFIITCRMVVSLPSPICVFSPSFSLPKPPPFFPAPPLIDTTSSCMLDHGNCSILSIFVILDVIIIAIFTATCM